MGSLREVDGEPEPLELAARTLVGRSGQAELCLRSRWVSGEHAVIYWDGACWQVRDLGSRNGTYVDGAKLDANTPQALAVGSTLGFGQPTGTWRVVEVSPPVARAVHAASGRTVLAEDGVLSLPDAETPEVMVFEDAARGWVAESEAGTRPVATGGEVEAGGERWILALPSALWATHSRADELNLDTVRLRFTVSRDEEHVTLDLVHAGGVTPTRPRTHHYLLVTLARVRLADAALPPSEQGWTHKEDLAEMLRMSTQAIEVQILRARRQLSAAGLVDAAAIVERRLGTGQLRLGSSLPEIVSV